MNVLQIANNFAINNLYTLLFKELRDQEIIQQVYCPVRTAREASYKSETLASVPQHVPLLLKQSDRIFYRAKVAKIAKDVAKKIDLTDIHLIHAHTLYSDGGVAYLLKKRHGTPYIVAVRSTDLNLFDRLRPDLRLVRNAIMANAKCIITLSPVYRDRVLASMPSNIQTRMRKRVLVIPNGINGHWLRNPYIDPQGINAKPRILYVGTFERRKNVPALLHAFIKAQAVIPMTLTLVGGGGDQHDGVLKQIQGMDQSTIFYKGRVMDIDRLIEIFREHDVFAMPSFHETFGLVYIEALSQGLPILHSMNEGVDGFFPPGSVAEAVNPHDIDAIASKIVLLCGRAGQVHSECVRRAQQFKWNAIASQYVELYQSVLES